MQTDATPVQISEVGEALQKWGYEIPLLAIPAFQILMGELNVMGDAVGGRL